MPNTKRNTFLFLTLFIGLIFLFFINLSFGSVTIPFKEVFNSLTGEEVSKQTWEYIVVNYRLPKAITAVLTGMGLSISGLLMQTLFRNPLAGPDVLGLSSGSSLAVAFVILGAGFMPSFLSEYFLSPYIIMIASCLGSLSVLLTILLVSQRLRDTMSILIMGMMFSSFTVAIISILIYFSSAEQLQKFTFWSMGNLGNLSWLQIIVLTTTILIGLFLSLLNIKALDALLLGEKYAKSIGVNYSKVRVVVILATSVLTGSITAFVGPIAFVGLAVPHMAKLLFRTSSHIILFWSTLFIGASIMLFCDVISQMPGSDTMLPINAITSIIGAPVVVWLLIRKRSFN